LNMMNFRLKANQRMWDKNAEVHTTHHGGYAVQIRQLLSGKRTWSMPLPDTIGPVRGKRLLHLQCHFGLDSLQWAARGAKVAGVDFSPRAIAEARKLSRRTGIPATFVESEISSLPRKLKGRFDIVLTYYGTICWLPDLRRWGAVIAHFLKPGGFFYIADGHPMANSLEFDGPQGAARLARAYLPGKPERWVGSGTYDSPKAKTGVRVSYEWSHSLAEILGSLRGAGLAVEYLHEFPYSFYDVGFYTKYKLFREDRRGFWHLKEWGDKLPLMFSVKAVKPVARRK